MSARPDRATFIRLIAFAAAFPVAIGLNTSACDSEDSKEEVILGSDPNPQDPTIYAINVSVSSTGDDIPTHNFRVHVGDANRAIAPVGGFQRFENLSGGPITVSLSDVDENCTIQGTHPRQVQGPPTQAVDFQIACATNVGEVGIFNDTRGDPGVEAYLVNIDGTESPIRPDFNEFFDVPPGERTVELKAIPPHCFLIGENPRTVTVVFGQRTTVSYIVDCTQSAGTLRVITRSSGEPRDPDDYLVNVQHPDPAVFSSTIDFSSEGESSHDFVLLPPANYVVTLANVADNCTFTPPNPQIGGVGINFVQTVTYDVSCGPVGSVRVAITTSGASLDPDGYTLTVHDQVRTVAINSPSGELFHNLPAGESVDVLLEGVAANCTVDGANPQSATVVADVEVAVTFTVTCTGTGSLEVTTMTTGGAAPGGYELQVAGGTEAIGTDETLLIEGLTAGDQEVHLVHGTSNCTVAGDNPRTVAIVADDVVATTFDVSCPAPTPPILFESAVDGDFEIYATHGPGDAPVKLTDNEFEDHDPSWSWDNTKIVFRSDRSGVGDIWMMDANGANPVNLTDNSADNADPAFSTDGMKVVYEEEDPQDGTFEIFQMDLASGDVIQLTKATRISEAPQYSPDGTKILFKSDRTGFFDIFLMDPDGENEVNLTNTAWNDFDPSWDPNGSRIVFSRDASGIEDLYFLDMATNQVTKYRADNNLYEWHPVFSTDGSQIVFTSDSDGDYDLYIANADGSGGRTRLTTNNAKRDDDAEFVKPGS